MAIINTKLGGTDASDGDVLYADDLNDTFDAIMAYAPVKYLGPMLSLAGDDYYYCQCALAHSATKMTAHSHSKGIYQTSDYTVPEPTWTQRSATNYTIDAMGTVCISTPARAIIWRSQGNTVAYTTNSGDTWTAGTNVPNCAELNDVSYPTSGLAVGVGRANSGQHAWYSTNGGSTWTQATTAGTQLTTVYMFNGTTGFALDQNFNIWITSDSGDTWTDTTYDGFPESTSTVGPENSAIYAISATEWLACSTGKGLTKGTTSADGTYKFSVPSYYAPCEIVKATNGNIYSFWKYTGTASPYVVSQMLLFESTDDGDNWTMMNITGAVGCFILAVATSSKNVVTHVSNKLYIQTTNPIQGALLEIDVSSR